MVTILTLTTDMLHKRLLEHGVERFKSDQSDNIVRKNMPYDGKIDRKVVI